MVPFWFVLSRSCHYHTALRFTFNRCCFNGSSPAATSTTVARGFGGCLIPQWILPSSLSMWSWCKFQFTDGTATSMWDEILMTAVRSTPIQRIQVHLHSICFRLYKFPVNLLPYVHTSTAPFSSLVNSHQVLHANIKLYPWTMSMCFSFVGLLWQY